MALRYGTDVREAAVEFWAWPEGCPAIARAGSGFAL